MSTGDLALTWWGHASTTVDLGGVRVATDPLLSDQLFHLRRYAASPAAHAGEADVVLISHLHHDHLHLPSLRRFAPDVPILVPRGGEPLLRADFWELLDEAVRRGFHTRVFTSGYLVDAAAAGRLAASGAAGVDVSFYSSDPAVFDAVTRVPGSFDRVMAAIERLAAAGLPPRLKTPGRSTTRSFRSSPTPRTC